MGTLSKATLLVGGATTAILAGGQLSDDAAYAQSLPAPGSFSWTGFYIGLQGGGIWSDEDSTDFGQCGPFSHLVGRGGTPGPETLTNCFPGTIADPASPVAGTFPSFDLDDDYAAWTGSNQSTPRFRGLFGDHLGYNQQIGRFVFGIESDFSVAFGGDRSREINFEYFESASGPCESSGCDLENYDGTGTVKSESTLDWLTTLRARMGMAVGPEGRLFLYGTGGLALAGVSSNIHGDFDGTGGIGWCDDCTFGNYHKGDNLQVGVTFGAGGEYAFTNNVSFGLEYLFTHFGSGSDQSTTFFADNGRQFDVNLGNSGLDDLQIVRARLDFRFGGP